MHTLMIPAAVKLFGCDAAGSYALLERSCDIVPQHLGSLVRCVLPMSVDAVRAGPIKL